MHCVTHPSRRRYGASDTSLQEKLSPLDTVELSLAALVNRLFASWGYGSLERALCRRPDGTGQVKLTILPCDMIFSDTAAVSTDQVQ